MDIKQNRVKLHTLERKRRGFAVGRKKVPKNVTVMKATDDSELFSKFNDSIVKSYMIPTATSKSMSVKSRFVQYVCNNPNEKVLSGAVEHEENITPVKMNQCCTQSTPKQTDLPHTMEKLFERSTTALSPINISSEIKDSENLEIVIVHLMFVEYKCIQII